jgi:hypothetical protein
MAYIYDPNTDDKDKQQQLQGGSTPAPTSAAPSSMGTSGSDKPQQAQGSGSFTNLQSYIRANQGTDAGQRVGSGVLGSADGALDASKKAVDGLNAITPGAGPAAMGGDDEAFLNAKQTAQGFQYSNKNDVPAYQNFANQQADQAKANLDRYNNIFSKYGQGPGTYQGPSKSDVTNQSANALSSITSAQQAANILKGDNKAGRSQLLQTQYGQGKEYASGQNKLDSFLLERNYGDQFDPKFKQASTALAGQTQQTKDLTASKSKAIDDTQSAYTSATDKWRNLLNGAQSTVNAERDFATAAQVEANQLAAANQPAPTPEVQPMTSTDTVSSGTAGDKIGHEQTTTMYPDGSYDVLGEQGEVIHYNADGSIKGTSGTNIFT